MWNPARFQNTAIQLLMKHMQMYRPMPSDNDRDKSLTPALPSTKKGTRKKPSAGAD
jgi:hypothetical protein